MVLPSSYVDQPRGMLIACVAVGSSSDHPHREGFRTCHREFHLITMSSGFSF